MIGVEHQQHGIAKDRLAVIVDIDLAPEKLNAQAADE